MKKLLFALAVLLTFTACHRPRVRHDRSKRMPKMHVPVDTAQKNDIKVVDSIRDYEDNIVLPHESNKKQKAIKNIDKEIERMMQGEDVDFGE